MKMSDNDKRFTVASTLIDGEEAIASVTSEIQGTGIDVNSLVSTSVLDNKIMSKRYIIRLPFRLPSMQTAIHLKVQLMH